MKRHSSKYLWFSVTLSAYFMALFLVAYFQVQGTLIGVFGELLTLPLMVAQLVLLIILSKLAFKKEARTITNLMALIISLVTSFLIIQTF